MYSLHPVVIFPVSVASQWVCSISTAVHIAALDLERGCHLVVINLINVEGGGNTQPKGILNPAENPTRGNTQPRKIQPRENSTQGTLNPREDSTQGTLNPKEDSTQGNTQPRGTLNPGEDSTQGKTQPGERLNPDGLSRVLDHIIVESKVLDHRTVKTKEQIGFVYQSLCM